MSKPTYPQNRLHQREKGFSAFLVVAVTAVLGLLSFYTVEFGRNANRVNMEKQLLDSHAYIVGKQLISEGINSTCANGEFVGDTEALSAALFGELDQVNAEDRTYTCEELEMVTRDDGTYRRYRVASSYNALQDPNNPNQGRAKERGVIVEVKEINGEVERPRPQIMFILDYSGSMNSNGRAGRLKSAMQSFVNANYEADYGVILFDSGVRTTIGLGSGAAHNQNVMAVVNSNNPGGGTNFNGPLQNAYNALNQTANQHSYIVLVSDGQPGDGSAAQSFVNSTIRGIDPNICLTRSGNVTCHTVYTLGVDNANMGMLQSLSGNAATAPNDYGNFAFAIASQNTDEAFGAIVDDILCSFGPLEPQPSVEEEDTIHVFLNEESLTVNVDYEYDRNLNAVKLYDSNNRQACTDALNNGGAITIRYGKPRIVPEQ